MKTRLRIFASLSAIVLIGAGCLSTSRQTKTPAPYEPLAWLPPTTSTAETINPIDELRAALTAFQDSKSFHTEIYVTSDKTKMLAKLDVMKPDRFRGTLEQAANTNPADVIGVGTSLYVRASDGSWTIVDDKSASVSSFARTAQSAGRFIVEKAIPDGSAVTRTEDAANRCTKLETTIKPGTSEESLLTVCVADGRPSSISVTSKDVTYTASYSNYNDLFSIERPSIKK